jgi:hypothetical protein
MLKLLIYRLVNNLFQAYISKLTMKFYTYFFMLFIAGSPVGGYSQSGKILKSPGERVELVLDNSENTLVYEISYLGQKVITPSKLGLRTNLGNISRGNITSVKIDTKFIQWEPLFGERSLIEDLYTEIKYKFTSVDDLEMIINFRLYDNGIAFRYEILEQNGINDISILEDYSEFMFSGDYLCRIIGENVEVAEFDPVSISEIEFSKPPILLDGNGVWIAITEAATFDFSMLYLVNDEKKTGLFAEIGPSHVSLPAKTPWRVVMLGEQPGELIESDLLLNLNNPPALEDLSWIKPGKSLWDWRNHKYVAPDGFTYEQDNESLMRLIDFAANNNLQYVLVDAGWYSEKGPQYPRIDLDILTIIQYGKAKDIGIMLYLDRSRPNTVNDWDLDNVLQTFQEWGVSGIKYGFLAGEFAGNHNVRIPLDKRKDFVDVTWKIVQTCAKHKMLVNFHDNPLTPGGEIRTWPNLMVTEYGHAQQDGKKSFNPSKAVSVPFVNGLTGPLDLSNGFYDLNNLQRREKVDKNGLFSTVVGETARVLVNYSPLVILPDNGDVYKKKDDLFGFIRQMPTTWEESMVLEGIPGKYIVVARKSGSKWFIGANTNESPRTLKIPLNFLEEGDYSITLYMDDKDSHYINNKEAYNIRMMHGDRNSVIEAPMAAGGGFCMIIQKI